MLMADNFEITEDELMDAFRTFDADGNGTLCEEEIFDEETRYVAYGKLVDYMNNEYVLLLSSHH